jgi:hypothetical protein
MLGSAKREPKEPKGSFFYSTSPYGLPILYLGGDFTYSENFLCDS